VTTASAAPTAPALDLLDQPPLHPDELGRLEDLGRAVLGTAHDIVPFQAEAILALEAVARSVAAPGRRALNVVTGPYGAIFGGWMREMGADVLDVTSAFDGVATVDAVAAAIAEHRPAVVAVVQAEAATGGTNPVVEILAAARAAGAVTALDAVAAIGAEPVPVDEWGVDITVIGGQKSLAGPAGVSLVAVSPDAWRLIEDTPSAPRGSSLSLLDWRDAWLRTDRSLIPGLPSWLESRALVQAIERVLDEGLDAVNHRHRRAAAATLAGAAALGLEAWQRDAPRGAAPVVTALRIPAETPALQDGALGGILSPGNGALHGALIRVNHVGRGASLEAVSDALRRLAAAVETDPDAALGAAARAWAATA
jgi:aspartate aminotransferase-like enzyme